MRKIIVAFIVLFTVMMAVPIARADNVGAVIGGTTGLIFGGPPGAIIGAIIGAIWGRPFWGPPMGDRACWIDNHFHRHCQSMLRFHQVRHEWR